MNRQNIIWILNNRSLELYSPILFYFLFPFMKKAILYFFLFITVVANAQIPSPQSFLGYELGKHFTPHNKIVAYFEAVAKATPQTMKLEQYGITNEGRPLELAYISTAENIGNLEQIRTNNLRLAGMASGTASTENQKIIIWLSYNVHGNEPSSSEASMATLYELLTSNTTNAKEWLKNTVVIIDPCINPDGRERYVNWYNSVVGSIPNPDPQSREHSEPWPGGRSNHYNFDLNRDWAWQTQLETQQRMKKYSQWMPQIHCDYHEQGYNGPYYFAPGAAPYHEVITPWERDFQTVIGRNHAKYFDANGWLYFTKEEFDLFYPSYGDTWPLYNGSIGMTYEQGGIRAGLAIINNDGDTLTLHDRIMHHFTTGISTVEIASQHAKELLDHFKQFFDDARTNGVGEYKSFVMRAKGNENKIAELTNLLDKNNIAYQTAAGGTAKGYDYFTGKTDVFTIEKGDLVISTMQTKGVLAKVLFEPKSKLEDSVTYDITAWSLPYVYGLQAFAVKEKVAVAEYQKAVELTTLNPNAIANVYGFIKPWQSFEDAQFLAQLMKKGIKVRMSEKAFTAKGKVYQPGSLIIIKTSNQKIANFGQTILALANENHIVLDTISTGFVDKGTDFGSVDVKGLWAPRVACLTGETVGSLSAGEVWHYFEKQINYPVTMINANDVGRVNWKQYDVLVVPNGYYKNIFAKDGDIKTWVQQGGRLIVMEDAVSQLAGADWGLVEKKNDDKGTEKDSKKDEDIYADVKPYGNAERESLTESNPGSIFKIALDNTHPLAFGYPNFYYTLKQDNTVYEFLKSGWNVGIIKKDNQVAGFTGSKAIKKLKDGVLLGQFSVGRGSVVFFADDPLFRSFWANGKLLFANAVFMVEGGNHL